MLRRRWFSMGMVGAVCLGAACAQGGAEGASGATFGGSPDASVDAAPEATAGLDAAGTSDVGASGEVDAAGDAAPAEAGTAADAAPPVTDASQASDAPPTCTGTNIVCGGQCVDPTSDPNNCGACAKTCGTGLCGVTVAADMSASPKNWTFNGSAVWSAAGPSAEMTAAGAAGVAGTVIYANPIVTDAFTASFQFRMGENGGGRYDGMGFMLETLGPTAVGEPNGALGMASLGGYGVEFDVYDNGECGDVSDDQIGIDLLQSCSGTLPTSIFASPDLSGSIDIADASWHTAAVSLSAGAMSVTVDGTSIASGVALTGFVSGTSYYYGFSGGTGGASPNGGIQTEAKDVSITFPTPRCL